MVTAYSVGVDLKIFCLSIVEILSFANSRILGAVRHGAEYIVYEVVLTNSMRCFAEDIGSSYPSNIGGYNESIPTNLLRCVFYLPYSTVLLRQCCSRLLLYSFNMSVSRTTIVLWSKAGLQCTDDTVSLLQWNFSWWRGCVWSQLVAHWRSLSRRFSKVMFYGCGLLAVILLCDRLSCLKASLKVSPKSR